MAFGPLFPTANNFWWVGIDFISETDYKKPNSTKFSANTLVVDAMVDAMVDECYSVPLSTASFGLDFLLSDFE